jgi:DNA-binding SARP family transcriptional activator
VTHSASHFDVLVLGPFAVFRDAEALETSGWQRKVHALFRMLVTSPERRRSRDELVDILWPDAQYEAGARNLRVVLYMLRRGLGGCEPSPVLSEQGWIGLSPAHEWDIDLARFETLAAQAGDDIEKLETAAGFYRGEPLVEDRYEDWAIAIRGRVQRTWREICLRLARLHEKAGELQVAATWLDRILEVDPLDEEAMIPLLTVLGELGRRTEALRRFHQFAQGLEREMELAPSEEMLRVVEELKSAGESRGRRKRVSVPAEPVRPVPVIPRYSLDASGRIVGREKELGRILWTLPPLNVVAPRMAVITGEGGIGKTRLLSEVASRARKAGLLTLAGAGYELEGQLIYGPIRDALSDYVEEQPETVIRDQFGELLPDIARIVPELRLRLTDIPLAAGSVEDQRLRLFLAVTKAFEHIARDMPLVLLLDDLHWADEASIHMLHFMVRRATGNRMLIVAAYCPTEELPGLFVARLVDALEEEGNAIRIALGPLSPDALQPVLEERVRRRVPEDLVARIHQRSGGNPLKAIRFLCEPGDANPADHAKSAS